MRLILASQSPARLATLRSAGIEPVVQVSGVDEDAVLAEAAATRGPLAPADVPLLLARAKAERVVDGTFSDTAVLGCDSMFEIDGTTYGKPANSDEATERWRLMRGRTGVLHTGHWIIDRRDPAASGTEASFGSAAATKVHFADVTDDEIDAYVATGEPLRVAGAFTVDGLGGFFVTGIEGDHHAVVGLSLPLLRTMLAQIGVAITDLWRVDPDHEPVRRRARRSGRGAA